MTPAASLPSWRHLGEAVVVGAWTAAMTFFAGLIGNGFLWHQQDWKLAVEAGIAAALAALGWTGLAASRRGP